MRWHKAFVVALAPIAAISLTASAAVAQTFQNYRCADGTHFILGFYDADPRAFLQIDGKAVPLRRRLTLAGSRYSGSGVTLRVGKAGTTVKHLKRPATNCEPG